MRLLTHELAERRHGVQFQGNIKSLNMYVVAPGSLEVNGFCMDVISDVIRM